MKPSSEIADLIFNFMREPISGTPEEMERFEKDFIRKAIDEARDEAFERSAEIADQFAQDQLCWEGYKIADLIRAEAEAERG